jgi:hypothetical protein
MVEPPAGGSIAAAAPPLSATPVAAVPVASIAVTPPQPAVAPPPLAMAPAAAPAVAAQPVTAAVVPQPVAVAPAAPQPVAAAPVAAHPVAAMPAAMPPLPPPAAAVVPPPIPIAEPAVVRAPVYERAVIPREEAEAATRAAVDHALAPVQQTVRELLRRIEELEKRPAQTTISVAPADGYRQPQPSYPDGYRQPQASYAGVSITPRAPVLDVAAIERDASIQVDGALDGRKRKRRLAITFALLLILVFGGLFGALAHSYTPGQSTRETPSPRLASVVALSCPELASS